jgi:glycosyltransferase involved in cell wall biosynthesis
VCAKNQSIPLGRVLSQIVRGVPFENLIVVFGTSRDETRETAAKYTDKVFWDEDKGLGAARSLGMRKAESEIVAMIDSDVILGENWYSQLIGHFQDPDVAAVMGTCVYGYGCKPLEAYWEYQRRNERVNWGCQNTMFRRELVLNVGNFNEQIKGAGEDYELYQRLLRASYKWLWVREASAYHPMTMIEYINHVRWWSRGKPYIDEAAQWAAKTSIFRVYSRQMLYLIESFSKGVKLSVDVDPVFLLYWPALRMIQVAEVLKGLKQHQGKN